MCVQKFTFRCLAVLLMASPLLPFAAVAQPLQSIDYQDDPAFEGLQPGEETEIGPASGMDRQIVEPDLSELADIRRYSQEVAKLENQYGPYYADLSESLLGLGLAYQANGDHVQAIEELGRALHISRINMGLYHPGKIPLLEKLIDSYRATEDWPALEDNYYKLHQLYRRNYEAGDPRRLPGVIKLANWHLFAYEKAIDEAPVSHLIRAQQQLYQAAAIIRQQYGVNDMRQLDALTALVLIDFYLSREQPGEDDAGAARGNSPPVMQAGGYSGRSPFDSNFQSAYSLMYKQGKSHIAEILRIARSNEESHPEFLLDAKLLLGDWHLLFNKHQRADRMYQEVWLLAGELEAGDTYRAQAFESLIALPTLQVRDTAKTNADESLKDEHASINDDPNHGLITLAFDVSINGHPKDVELVYSDQGASSGDVNRAKRQLRAMLYRPLYEEGKAVARSSADSNFAFKYKPEQVLAAANASYSDLPNQPAASEASAETEATIISAEENNDGE